MPTAATMTDVLPDRFYTVANVSRLLGYCRQTVTKWVMTGRIQSNNMDPPRIPGWQVRLMADPHGTLAKIEPQESLAVRDRKALKRLKVLN